MSLSNSSKFDPQGQVYWGASPSHFPTAIWYDTSGYPTVAMKFHVGEESFVEMAQFDASDPAGSLAISGGGATPGSVTSALNDLSDVGVPSPSSGDALIFDGSAWVAQTLSSGGASTLSDLNDVISSAPISGQVLTFDGSNWIAQSLPTNATSLDGLSDVDTAAATNGQALLFDGSSWTAQDLTTASGTLDGLSDVNTAAATNGQALLFDGSSWTAQELTTVSGTLDGLSDVDTAAATNGQALLFDGSSWTAQNLTTVSGTLDGLSDVDTAAATNGQALLFDGSSWTAQSVPTAAYATQAEVDAGVVTDKAVTPATFINFDKSAFGFACAGRSSSFTLPSFTNVIIGDWNVTDGAANFDGATFTCPKTGAYVLQASVLVGTNAAVGSAFFGFGAYINGSTDLRLLMIPALATGNLHAVAYTEVKLNAGDTLQLYGRQGGGSGVSSANDSSATFTYFSARLA